MSGLLEVTIAPSKGGVYEGTCGEGRECETSAHGERDARGGTSTATVVRGVDVLSHTSGAATRRCLWNGESCPNNDNTNLLTNPQCFGS